MTKDISPIESVYQVIQYWLHSEIKEEGILEDVRMLITSSSRYDDMEAPFIWLEKGEITTAPVTHSNKVALDVPVSIICCDEIIDTVVEAEEAAYNLASRCITSLQLNMIRPRPLGNHVHIRDFRVDRFYPNANPTGAFKIENKTMLLAASRMDVIFTFEVDWLLYENIDGDTHTYIDYSQFEDDNKYDVLVEDWNNSYDDIPPDDDGSDIPGDEGEGVDADLPVGDTDDEENGDDLAGETG